MKALVTYFSASGVTARLAKTLAKAADADIEEIVPAQRYTDADLNWQNNRSRSSVEMNDKSCRPPMAKKIDVSSYDVIFVGFPIWWYREPSIIDTFMESADFSGKTIVPFATSGGSGMGDSSTNMKRLAPNAKVVAGKRFSSSTNENELAAWVKSVSN